MFFKIDAYWTASGKNSQYVCCPFDYKKIISNDSPGGRNTTGEVVQLCTVISQRKFALAGLKSLKFEFSQEKPQKSM